MDTNGAITLKLDDKNRKPAGDGILGGGLTVNASGFKKSVLGIDNGGVRKSHVLLTGDGYSMRHDTAQAIKKSTMVLSQLKGTLEQSKKLSSDKSNVNAVTGMIGQEMGITVGNVAQGDRPQVWTKSTTKAAEQPVKERRNSIFNPDGSPKKKKTLTKKTLTGDDLKDMIENITVLESRRESVTADDFNKFNQSSKNVFLNETSIIPEPHEDILASKTSINSKASMLVDNLLKNINNLGKPLRGPILRQLFVLYTSYLLILFVSWYSKWVPHIQFFASFAYFVISLMVLQIGRVAYSLNIGSVIPLYISLIPFAGIIFISRESCQVVFVLWFASVSFIFLQSGHQFLRLHFLLYCLLLFIVYILAIFGASRYYSPDCDGIYCGEPLNPPISPAKEAVMLVNSIFCIFVLLSLEYFIKLNAIELLERDSYMTQLVEDNEALKKQLKGEDQSAEEDTSLEVPLTRATNILKQIKDDQTIDRMVVDEIDFILGILSQDTDNLFVPDLYKKPVDSDVHDWLNDMMVADKNPNNVSAVVILQKKEDPTIDQPLMLPEDSRIFNFLSERLEDPEFDIFELYNLAQGKVLYYIGWHIFRKHGFAELYGMKEMTFRRWLGTIEAGYLNTNPYHNALHAADVTHSMHYYVSRTKIWSVLRPEEKLAVIIAPIIHDYKHPGVNNAFQISTRAPLAIRYNDICVLENFHVASVYELMAENETFDILAHFPPESQKLIREMIISMVLATDMAVHFDWIGKFKSKMTGAGLNLEIKQDRKLLLNMAMKCADINNPTKKLIFCRKWTDMIMREFFAQGEEEKSRGLKVSMFMDKDTTDIPKCQVGFIDFIVRPLYEAWGEFMKEDIDVHLQNINENKAFWKSCADNPIIMKEIDLAKTEKWVPLAEAAGDLELLLKQGISEINSFEKHEPPIFIQQLDVSAMDTAAHPDSVSLVNTDNQNTDRNYDSINPETTSREDDLVASMQANETENQTLSLSESGL